MLIAVAISAVLAMVAVWFAAKQRGGASWLLRGQGHYGAFQSVYEMGPQGAHPHYQQRGPPQFYPGPQGYPQQQSYGQPVYAMPPQGVQPGPYQQPVPHQAAPQTQKTAVAGEQAVFK